VGVLLVLFLRPICSIFIILADILMNSYLSLSLTHTHPDRRTIGYIVGMNYSYVTFIRHENKIALTNRINQDIGML